MRHNILWQYLLWGCIALLAGGCNSGGSDGKGQKRSGGQEMTELPLPMVPTNLTAPEERAAYVVEHFWDALDFKTNKMSLDTAFMEQSFANYAAILAMVGDERVARGSVSALLGKARESQGAYDLLDYVVEKYLDEPNSPVRNEDIYMMFLEAQQADSSLPAYKQERVAYKLEQARKNRPGSEAADFRMVLRDGTTTTLHRALGEGETLLLFYDPDCQQCDEVKALLQGEAAPDEGVTVLAVDVTGDRQRWDSTKGAMPAAWTVGFATDPIEEEEIYVLRAMPTLYLLGPDGTVLLKDFSLAP